MKRILTVTLLAMSGVTFAQESITKLQAPSSPAAGILGLQPTAVLAPKSFKALETSLFSNFMNSSGSAVIPNDFALEFTPYWTKDHGLSLSEYLYPKKTLDQIVRNSSFSLATTQNFLLGDSSASNALAFGYRTTFYFSNKADRDKIIALTDKLKANKNVTAEVLGIATGLIQSGKAKDRDVLMRTLRPTIVNAVYTSGKAKSIKDAEVFADELIEESTTLIALDPSKPDPFMNSFSNLLTDKLAAEGVFVEYKDYIKERYGFSMDLAYAGLLNFPTNNFEYSFLIQQSLWLSPTYRFEDNLSFLKVIGVLKYSWYNIDYYNKYFPIVKVYENNVDYGLALTGTFKKFSVGMEMVGRSSSSVIPAGTDIEGNELFRKEKDEDFQYIGTFSYALTDQIVLSYNFGSRFEPILNPESTLVSVLSVNLGFGSPNKKDIR